jgi:hypothetical protein
VRYVPQDGDTRGLRDRLDVGERAGPVGDVRQRDEGHSVPGTGSLYVPRLGAIDRVWVEVAELATVAPRHAIQHVAVGGEVVRVGDHRARPRVEHGRRELEEVHRGRVGHDHLARAGAEHLRRQQVPYALGQVDPIVPCLDQLGAPLVHEPGQALPGGDRQAPERVAVEVDRPRVLDHEAIAEGRERVGGVEALGVGTVDHHGRSIPCVLHPRPGSEEGMRGGQACRR